MKKHSEIPDVAFSGGPLSTEEAAELASEVAELAKSGLPLDAGLRALADELHRNGATGRRLPTVLREMSKQLNSGASLDAAMEAQGSRLPSHLRGLMLAGVRSGRLPEVLEEFVDLERSQTELRRRVSLALAYPTVLMVAAALLFVFIQVAMVGPFTQIFRDFEVDLPIMTQFFLGFISPASCALAGWALLLAMAVLVLPRVTGVAGAPRFLYVIPVVGPLWRFSRLAQCSRLMALLLGQEVPLPDALRLSAAGLRDAYLAAGCRRAADEVETGRSLAESLASQRQFPPSMIPLIDWGERTPALADSFRAAAEVFQNRAQSQGVFLEAVLLPVTFLLVALFVASFVIAMLMPLFSLISALS